MYIVMDKMLEDTNKEGYIMTPIPAIQELIEQKLAAFEQLQPEFEQCFQFIQQVHGQQRLATFPVADMVRYLHGLWICELKSLLLSVPRTVKVYEGRYCLELLCYWQEEGDATDVVAFLHRKLDMMPLADLTRQVHLASTRHADDGLAQRLRHGRMILLNRGMNLMQALDTLFSVSEEELLKQVTEACERYGHLASQITKQIEEMNARIYSPIPHPALARRNMVVMNKLGMSVMHKPADLPGQRSWRVLPTEKPLKPFAEHIVAGYQELTTPLHNNLLAKRFVDRAEHKQAE